MDLEFKEETKFFVPGQDEFDHLNFHYRARKKRPAMWKMALLVALAQPSSGAAERVFSRYRNLFTPAQTTALFSLKRLAIFLSCNERKPTRAAWRAGGLNV